MNHKIGVTFKCPQHTANTKNKKNSWTKIEGIKKDDIKKGKRHRICQFGKMGLKFIWNKRGGQFTLEFYC